jgi:hypothetical protein
MYGDVALCQHRHAGNAAIRLEMVQMDMQERRARCVHASTQGRLDMIDIVEPPGLIEVHDEVRAGAPHAISRDEMIVPRLGIGRKCPYRGFFFSGGTWSLQALPRSQEGVL